MDIIHLLGVFALAAIVLLVIGIITILALLAVSLKTNRAYFPGLMVLLITALESPVKTIFRFLRLDDSAVDRTLIELRNRLFRQRFAETAFAERVLFMPQCLRSTDCPAKLTPDGIQCVKCGKCVIKDAKESAEKLGYHVYVVPGSSFIRRVILAQKPAAIVGVGCRHEVKGGLEICDRYGVPGQGVVLRKSGCVNTVVDLDDLLETLAVRCEARA